MNERLLKKQLDKICIYIQVMLLFAYQCNIMSFAYINKTDVLMKFTITKVQVMLLFAYQCNIMSFAYNNKTDVLMYFLS